MWNRMPLWLRILVTLIVISILIPFVQPLWEVPSLLPLVFFSVLIIFPGRTHTPRLLRVMPWLWGMEWFATFLFLIVQVFAPQKMPPELQEFTRMELLAGTLLTPILVWNFIRGRSFFRPLLLFMTAFDLTETFSKFSGHATSTAETLEFASHVAASLLSTGYLVWKFSPKSPSTSHAHERKI